MAERTKPLCKPCYLNCELLKSPFVSGKSHILINGNSIQVVLKLFHIDIKWYIKALQKINKPHHKFPDIVLLLPEEHG